MRIRAAISSALGLQFLLFPLPIALGQESVRSSPPDCERLVEFRDGSILRLQLPASYEFGLHNVDGGGAPELSKVQLSSPLGIRFSELPALQQLGTIQEAAAQLRVDSFQLREQALRTLVKGSNGFRPFIEDLFRENSDPESRWRLATVLELIPSQPGIYQHAYDELITADDIIKGDVQDWRIALDYRGSGIVLDRKSVRAIRQGPQEREQWETPVIASTEAIRKDLDALFPHDCMRIDFEFDSMGDALRPGRRRLPPLCP